MSTPSYREYRPNMDRAYGPLGSYDYFQEIKARVLTDMLNEADAARILDVGSGVGTMLSLLPDGVIKIGVEPDSELIGQLPRGAHPFETVNASGTRLPFPDGAFDLVYMACVLHHVPPPELAVVLEECRRVLKPGGRFVVFEHNAYNLPVVLFLKMFVKIDRDARFLTPIALRRLLNSVQLSPSRLRYICFFPKFLRSILPLEKRLGWLPLGGQYYTVSIR